MKVAILASQNKNKIKEIDAILGEFGIKVISRDEAGLPTDDIEETGITFEENSLLKANAIRNMIAEESSLSDYLESPVIADDSGLMVDALNGEPGVYSARYGGLESDSERTALVLEKMKDVPEDRRGAHFTCSICFIDSDGEHITAEGKVFGTIGYEPVGTNGFGYDPIFMYEGKSFAEVSAEVKNNVSHRANALRDLEEKLKER